ncbi:MAG: epoxyqueuosine reductase QueH, partial [Kiritimatiellae bacterium]|nr:epoxyqueuosine reductase QueH [Kiritimatiellia bacterium]
MDNPRDILLHTCCGPCASACAERLKGEGRRPTLFFSNANIAPEEEYARRREAARRLAEVFGLDFIEDTGASHKDWLASVARGLEDAPEGGERCCRCFEFSLSRAAAFAAAQGFPEFTTSLTVSPHKRSATVFDAGRAAAASAQGAAFAEYDFKKHDGFRRSVALARELGLYRQDYCGCE